MIARFVPARVSAGHLAGLLVASAMAMSSIVFSEPAVADALLLVMIFAVPALGAVRFGRITIASFVIWLVIVALGLAGTVMSTTMDTAVKHQLITLFLAASAFVLAGYITADPEPRVRLVMLAYVLACLVATAAAFIGYFNLLPGAYDLFTNLGRARGTFKDPNVYGAAMAPGVVLALWCMLRETAGRAYIAAAVALVLTLGVLLSVSRGAWISTALSLALLGWITLVRSRRRTDFWRFGVVGALGTLALVIALAGALQLDSVKEMVSERANLDQGYDEGADGRFGGQAKAIGLMLDNPLGIGTFTFRDSYHHEEVHNVYLSQFLNAGWLGGMLYIVSVLLTLWIGFRGSFRNGVLQGPFLIATTAFAGVAFEGLVVDTDHWRHFFILMACIWGLADAVPPRLDPSRRRGDWTPFAPPVAAPTLEAAT